MNQSEQKTGMSRSIRRTLSSMLLVAILFVGGRDYSQATQQTKPQAQQTVQSVVAKQAALVTEFDVNGLEVSRLRRDFLFAVALRTSTPKTPASRR
jgi:hypothetical protein